jgi:hypothetical protein
VQWVLLFLNFIQFHLESLEPKHIKEATKTIWDFLVHSEVVPDVEIIAFCLVSLNTILGSYALRNKFTEEAPSVNTIFIGKFLFIFIRI